MLKLCTVHHSVRAVPTRHFRSRLSNDQRSNKAKPLRLDRKGRLDDHDKEPLPNDGWVWLSNQASEAAEPTDEASWLPAMRMGPTPESIVWTLDSVAFAHEMPPSSSFI